MFSAEKLLGGLLGSVLDQKGQGAGLGNLGDFSGGLASGAGKAGLAMGLLGVATAAFEHFSETRGQTQGGAAASGNPPPPPQGAVSAPSLPSAPPPPPPGASASTVPKPADATDLMRAAPPPPPPPAPSANAPAGPTAGGPADEDEALIYVRGMIAAAAADGHIDEEEREKILGQLERTGLDQEEREFLLGEMDRPASIDMLAAAVRTPEQALNLYACSLLAVDVDTDAERAHLRQLSDRLQLSADALSAVHARYHVSL